VKVHDPSGQVWRVHRRWAPWNPRRRRALDLDLNPFGLVDGVDSVHGLLLALAAGIVLALLLPIVLLVLVTGAEVLLILVVLPFAIGGRMLLGRKWWVQVRRGWHLEREEMVGDWQASGLAVRDVAARIERPSGGAAPRVPHRCGRRT
jgi:hypothetical protein